MMMSIPNAKSKSGSEEFNSSPPVEIWRVIFSYLRASDLCHCAVVSKDWHVLVDSIDSTRWRELYLQQFKHKYWKHPFWPNEMHVKPKSWKNCYRLRYLSSKLWLMNDIYPTCSVQIFKRKRTRRILSVGTGKTYHSIKSALEKSSAYDQIFVYPGLYQESSVLHLRFPVAIIGTDDCSKVVLIMQFDMQADSAKLENLTIKPVYPRARGRSNSVPLVKVPYGHIFIHNCVFEQGYVHISYPGMADIYSCTFNSSFLNLQGVGFSTVTNCEFNPDRCAIFIEDPSYPSDIKPSIPEDTGGWIAAANEKKFEELYLVHIKPESLQLKDGKMELKSKKYFSSFITESDVSESDNETRVKIRSCLSLKSRLGSFKSLKNKDSESSKGSESERLDMQTKNVVQSIKGVIIKNILVSNGRGGITVCRLAQAWVENSTFRNLTYGIRCLNNSKCVLLNNKIHSCETTGIFLRDHSCGLIAGNQIFSNGEAGIDIRSCADPLIQHNEIHGGKRSGIVCLDSGKGIIRENDIYNNKEAGIYILHRGSPKVVDNFIWSGRAAGIAVTEDGKGHISHNIISGMEWAGIDIRHGGNPVVSHNIIQNGQSDGIVVGEGGKSIILDNYIDGNNGCGVWILDGSHPLIHTNRIINSGNSGIAFMNNSDIEHDFQTLTSEFPQQARLQNVDDGRDEQSLIGDEEFMFPIMIPDMEPESRFVHVSKPEKSVAQVEGNIIENNNGNGILYDGKDGIVISRNKVNNNLKHGITLVHTSEIIIRENNIRNSTLSGINVEIGVCCTVEGNGIFDNGEYGITTAGVGTIKDNDIFGNVLPCVCLRSCGDVSIVNNRFHTWKHECLYLDEKTRCILENNIFYMTQSSKEMFVHPSCDVAMQSNIIRIVPKYSPQEYKKCETLPWLSPELLLTGLKELRPIYVENVDEGAPFFTSTQMNQVNNRAHRSTFCLLL